MPVGNTITTSNLIGIPIAVLISAGIGLAWYSFQTGGEYRKMQADIDEDKHRIELIEQSESRGRLWERLSEHGKDISAVREWLARVDERSKMNEERMKSCGSVKTNGGT